MYFDYYNGGICYTLTEQREIEDWYSVQEKAEVLTEKVYSMLNKVEDTDISYTIWKYIDTEAFFILRLLDTDTVTEDSLQEAEERFAYLVEEFNL